MCRRSREQPEQDQWKQDARQTHAGGQHRHDFVRARHSPKREEQRQQERDRQKDDQDLRDLGQIISGHHPQPDMFVEEGRDVVAHVEDEPDRDKASDAVEIDLQENCESRSDRAVSLDFQMSNLDLRLQSISANASKIAQRSTLGLIRQWLESRKGRKNLPSLSGLGKDRYGVPALKGRAIFSQ